MTEFAKLRIAFLAGILGQGGAERQLYFIVKALRELGCRPDVFTFSQGEYWETPIRELGIKVVSIAEPGRFDRLKRLNGYIKQGRYDYIHSQHFYTNLYAVAVSLGGRTKCIGSIRNDAVSEVRGMGIWGRLSLILPPQLVANSYLGMANARKFFRRSHNVFFLPNCVDTEVFYPDPSKQDSDVFKVITVGTVWQPKRIDRVIEVAERLNRMTPKRIVFEIIGDGDQLDSMIELARSKRLLDSVIVFAGRSSNVAAAYRAADALLLTSDHEGTPNVVLEAMASGLAVVGTRVGDVPRLLVDGVTGFCVERDDIEKMAQILEILSRDKELRLAIGQRAREHVLSNYSQTRLKERLIELYFPT